MNPVTFLYEEDIPANKNKRYVWVTHSSYGRPLARIIQNMLMKSNILKNGCINFPISMKTNSFKQLTN